MERLARSQRFSPGGDGSCDRFRDAHCAACQLRWREGLLLQALRLKLAALALLLASDPRLLLLLQPQRQLFQQLALLLFPELTAAPAAIPTAGIPASAAPSGPSLEPLLDYIRRHLDQPLTLEHLVQRCHYSRRSLQYAFRQRFQLSPMAWIRQQRLERAWRRLSQPQPGDAVASIARSCGYRHLSSFSRDFRRAFGCLPSALLRSAHQRDSQATGCRPGAALRIRAAGGERKGGGAQPLTELSESDWLSHKPLPGDQAPNPS